MEIQSDELIAGLLEEVKRLTLENVALKTTLSKMQATQGDSKSGKIEKTQITGE